MATRKPFYKTPAEKFPVSVDFVNAQPPSTPALVSGTVSAIDDENTDKTSEVIHDPVADIENTKAIFFVQAGEEGKRYHIKLIVTFADGSVLQENFIMMIRNNH